MPPHDAPSEPPSVEPGGVPDQRQHGSVRESEGRDPGTPKREVWCEDGLAWLGRHQPLVGCSLITSLPDVSGMPSLGLEGWSRWFVDAAELVSRATPDDGVTIFYQTDIKVDGAWIDKSHLCHRAAERARSALLWHRIVCRKPAGENNFGRPAYSHLLCYSRGVRDHGPRAYPDVLPATGSMTWSQAMGMDACRLACAYVLSHTSTRTVVDPFCGLGSVLAVANAMGLDAVGVEIVSKRARRARGLLASADGFARVRSNP